MKNQIQLHNLFYGGNRILWPLNAIPLSPNQPLPPFAVAGSRGK